MTTPHHAWPPQDSAADHDTAADSMPPSTPIQERAAAHPSLTASGSPDQTIERLQHELAYAQRAHAAMAAEAERYRLLYEQTPAMYFTLTPEGHVRSVNDVGASELGYQPHELIGHSVLGLFDPSDHHTVQSQLLVCADRPGTTFDWEIQKIRKDGSRLWVKERARWITDPDGQPVILIVCQDITDRRLAEARAHQHERQLQHTTHFLDTLVQGAPLPIISMNVHGTVTSWNDAATTLFGWTAHEVLGRELPYVPAGEEAAADALWEQGLRQGIHGPIALHRQRKDGTPVDVLLWPVFIYDDAGQVITAIGLYVDQSDLQRAEADLRESEARLRAFASAIPGLAFILDEEGRYIEILGQEERLLYTDASQVKGRLLHEVLPKADADRFLAVIQNTLATGQSQRIEYPLPVKAGWRWFEARTSVMHPLPGKPRQIVWVAYDITDRKQAEEALRVSEERFAKAFRSSPHPVIITERDSGRCVEVNDAGLALFGYQRQEVVGRTLLNLGVWETQEERMAFMTHLATQGRVNNLEMRFSAKDRTPRQCLISCDTIEIDGIPCLVAVGTDITDQKRTEALLAHEFQVLELLAHDTPLALILNTICRLMEQHSPHIRASVLLLDPHEQRLRPGAGPSLPTDYLLAINGLQIGPQVGSCGSAAFLRETVIVRDIRTDPRWTPYCGLAGQHGLVACWSMPIKDPQGNVLGTFALYPSEAGEPTPEDLSLMERASHLAGLAITRTLARDERERLSRDLHDNTLQSLYAVGMQLEAAKLVAGTSVRKTKLQITHSVDQLNRLVSDVRQFITMLHTRPAPDMDLSTALRQLITAFTSETAPAPRLHIESAALAVIPPFIGEHLLSIVREALSNSLRHAQASQRTITLRPAGTAIELTISDNGIGFTPGRRSRAGHGLANMAARAKHIRARFSLTSAPGHGTQITILIPRSTLS